MLNGWSVQFVDGSPPADASRSPLDYHTELFQTIWSHAKMFRTIPLNHSLAFLAKSYSSSNWYRLVINLISSVIQLSCVIIIFQKFLSVWPFANWKLQCTLISPPVWLETVCELWWETVWWRAVWEQESANFDSQKFGKSKGSFWVGRSYLTWWEPKSGQNRARILSMIEEWKLSFWLSLDSGSSQKNSAFARELRESKVFRTIENSRNSFVLSSSDWLDFWCFVWSELFWRALSVRRMRRSNDWQ